MCGVIDSFGSVLLVTVQRALVPQVLIRLHLSLSVFDPFRMCSRSKALVNAIL